VKIDGKNDNISPDFAFIAGDHALRYSLFVDNCDISGFRNSNSSIFSSLYCTMADSIVVSNSVLHDSFRGINLHAEKEDGKYNAETVIFNNTVFANLTDYALDYYRGGNDESTVGGSLAINHCVFDSVGKAESPSILNLSRIMYVKINNSIFPILSQKVPSRFGIYTTKFQIVVFIIARNRNTRKEQNLKIC